ncbi:hypothetical protein P7C73_g6576, partial [Tremellales sp. Uapishka_1]
MSVPPTPPQPTDRPPLTRHRSPTLSSPDVPPSSSSTNSQPSSWPMDRRSPPPPSTTSSRPSSSRVSSSDTSAASRPAVDPSTAPTSPSLQPTAARTWRPTLHVPRMNRQRRTRFGSEERSDSQERSRWLSEDEGIGGSTSTPRRRRLSGMDDSTDRGGPGPSSLERSTRPKQRTFSTSRPLPRRVQSSETVPPIRPSPPPSSLQQPIGTQPPRIEDLVPPPPPAVLGLGFTSLLDPNPFAGAGSTASTPPIPVLSSAGIERMDPSLGQVPDYARGHGGDGIGGVNMASGSEIEDMEGVAQRQKTQKELVAKLRRILGCALCPETGGSSPPLHHPITLPCGHTLSSSHVSIPAPPPLQITSDLPHQIFAAQQRQHQQRLNLWAGVMCPIPTCKRYSADAAVPGTLLHPSPDMASDPIAVSSGALRSELLASGVVYYPPAPERQTHTPPESASDTSSPLLDISVDKILHIVLTESDRLEFPPSRRPTRTVTSEDETTDEEESSHGPSASHTGLSRDLADLGSGDDRPPGPSRLQPSSLSSTPPSRSSSKRPRQDHRPELTSRPRPAAAGPAEEWAFEKELLSVVECDVCAMLLYEPVTTPCQHTFCSKCLSRSLDHSSRCPLCRQDLPSFAFFQDHAVNKVVLTVIKTAFGSEYDERQRAIERDERDARLDTPIFVCTLAFPGMPTILHVFEPRYRLMIRRCIESSNPRFGMVLPARGTGNPALQGVMEYGTMLEIQSVQMLPDGRSMVETVGTHRFRLLEKGNLDGYTVGRIEQIEDISPEDEVTMEREANTRAEIARALVARQRETEIPPPVPIPAPVVDRSVQPAMPPYNPATTEVMPQTTEELMGICRAFIEQLRSGSAPWLLQRLNNTYGTMPTEASEFSYWMALVIPIDEYEKAKLLPIRSPRLRLKLIVHWVESLRSSWWFSSGYVLV